MKIAKQGWKYIAFGLAVAIMGGFWAPPLGALGLGFSAFCAYFFRDPERPLPNDSDAVYSPGDGRVLSVAREGPGDITTVRIFLSLFDVHVQRAPCSGTVDQVRYQKGSFLMAMKDESKANERSIVRLKPAGGREPLVFEQIAGFVARRIETWVKPGEAVNAGQRYGIIYFGSQVAVHLPAGCRPVIRPGERAVGGVTPIARWTE